MDRRTKIQLLDHWLSNPESMGDIPREFKDRVTTKDFFDIKKEMDWKPPTKENVEKLLKKTRYLGAAGGGKVSTKGNPIIILIFVAAGILPVLFRIISGLNMPPGYGTILSVIGIFFLVFIGIVLRLSFHATKKK